MISEQNIKFLKQNHRRYIIGTPKSQLKKFEKELLSSNWQTIQHGLEVQSCQSPSGDNEQFILCRSTSRREKEQAILDRFIQKIETDLEKIKQSCDNGRLKNLGVAERRIGRLLQRNTRAAGLFDIKVLPDEHGNLQLCWTKKEDRKNWAQLSHGCYLLRSNIKDWSAEQLWQAYIHLTDAEAAFRIQKSDLVLRPIWHQKKDRVAAHILVCFLDLVVWKCLARLCKKNGLGNEPRKVIDEIKRIKLTDVILPTKKGIDIKLHCVSQPDEHQKILLQNLGIIMPKRLTKNLKM
jgi:transposase